MDLSVCDIRPPQEPSQAKAEVLGLSIFFVVQCINWNDVHLLDIIAHQVIRIQTDQMHEVFCLVWQLTIQQRIHQRNASINAPINASINRIFTEFQVQILSRFLNKKSALIESVLAILSDQFATPSLESPIYNTRSSCGFAGVTNYHGVTIPRIWCGARGVSDFLQSKRQLERSRTAFAINYTDNEKAVAQA
ncbi:hypothetical protein OUZ56_022441 [Daphnia magna]|uniref:Uncharacterized protein n=1 Tax=Daphnia magna TaxID=35525 RepID=A0ABR0AWE3_9CRUS|nr:hypothetical protein OUZ56_022441 [Daphnia magna]